MSAVSTEQIAKVIIKIGAVIAGADGLDDREKAGLVQFASQRSGLSSEVIEAQVAVAEGGLGSITDADIQVLKSIGTAQVGQLLNEGLQKIAAADGNLSDREMSTLKAIWARLA